MKRSFKFSSGIGAVMLAVMLAVGAVGIGGAQAACDAQCGMVVTADYTLTGNIDCSTCVPSRHGLIIGAANITIDGAGYSITGATSLDECMVCVTAEGECCNHPCRCRASGTPNQCHAPESTTAGCGSCIASGVLNADPTAADCQHGYDGVTVKNLEITGFCDGIFMSGNYVTEGVNPGLNTLRDINIEHNEIHHNGMVCPTCYNDGIFTAEIGVPATAAGAWEANNPCGATPDSVIANNAIWGQLGRACESCPGGNCINLQGGTEDTPETTWYNGCVDVHNNRCINCSLSGIMLTHALQWTNIYKNVCKNNHYGGITIPCDFSSRNSIYHNFLEDNFGPGIAVMCGQYIYGNTVQKSKDCPGSWWSLGFVTNGYGIYVGVGKGDPVMQASDVGESNTNDPLFGNDPNLSCQNMSTDIYAESSTCITCFDNICDTTHNAAGCKRWPCPLECNDCPGDINNDGTVNATDFNLLNADWLELECIPRN